MQKIFVKRFLLLVSVALAVLLGLGYYLQSRIAQLHRVDNAHIKLSQIMETLRRNEEELSSLDKDLSKEYLTRAHALAYMVQQNPKVLDSLSELERIRDLLNVDEIHIIDANGILIAGTIPKYIGMDFRGTEQTKEFLKILAHPEEGLVQEIRPNGAEGKMFQYVGVARMDQPGIVQIGLAPTRMLEAKRKNELPYILSHVPQGAGERLFAVDSKTGEILTHSDASLVGRSISECGITPEGLSAFEQGGFHTFWGERLFCVTQDSGSFLLVSGQREKELYAQRGTELLFVFIYTILIMAAVAVAINQMLKRQILDGIHLIVKDLKEITEGNLETVVRVDSNPEFQELSAGINQMVGGIIAASGRVAKVINMVDMPIGVFEYSDDAKQVMASDRLRQVMGWGEAEAAALYRNKQRFIERLRVIMLSGEKEQGGACRISTDPERWIVLRQNSDQSGTFGVVSDVTEEIIEKRRIQHERDYDSLTGLRNLDRFREDVNRLVEQGEQLETAAMLMLDLDRFKGINDRFGHDYGDEYLRIAAGFFKKLEGGHSFAARRSGDEFFLFLHGYQSREEIRLRMDALYQWIADTVLHFPDGSEGRLNVSSGLAWYDGGSFDFERLIRAADEALYESKRNGRGRISYYQNPSEENGLPEGGKGEGQ